MLLLVLFVLHVVLLVVVLVLLVLLLVLLPVLLLVLLLVFLIVLVLLVLLPKATRTAGTYYLYMCKYIPARVSATNSHVVFSRETERMEVEKIYRLSEAAALQVSN